MKIILLLFSILTRFKPILGQNPAESPTAKSDSSKTSDESKKTGKFSECFTTECDATNFKMNIQLIRTCPQFADFKGLWLQIRQQLLFYRLTDIKSYNLYVSWVVQFVFKTGQYLNISNKKPYKILLLILPGIFHRVKRI